jgi:hypothetical protein
LEAFVLQRTRQRFQLIIFEDHLERVTATGNGQEPAAIATP